MTENIQDTALSYFKTFSEKNIDGLREMFDDNVTLRDWDIDEQGIENVLKANLNIFQNVQNINVIPKRITSKLDHSEYSHPSDILLLTKSPGIANTHKPLNIFEPIKVPATASYLLLSAKETDAAISGRLVPIAKTV